MPEPVTESPPRPSIWLVVHSLVAIGGALLFVSISAATIVAGWNPCDKIAAAILGTPCVLYAIAQYRGTFRGSATSALSAAVAQILVAIIGILIGTTIFFRFSASGAILAAVGVFYGLGVPLNLRWRARLFEALASDAPVQRKLQFSLIELIAFTAIFGAMLAVAVHTVRNTHPQTAEHVTALEAPFDLPEGVSDVSYHRHIRSGYWVEFTVEEAALVEWFETSDLPFHGESPEWKLSPGTGLRNFNRPAQLSGPSVVTIQSGLKAGWSEGDRGFILIFDRATKRAYYHAFFN